jgi:hypothetical protein
MLTGVLALLPITSAACRKFKGAIQMPNIGYGTNKKDRHVLPNGFKKVRGSSSRVARGSSSIGMCSSWWCSWQVQLQQRAGSSRLQ